jgi:hypothetical protein
VLKKSKTLNLMVVDLTEKVSVFTGIPKENHPALRSGFVGCPANPRWSASKFCAWRTGRQWRVALTQGKMVVRSTDSMLIKATEQETSSEDELPASTKLLAGLTFDSQLVAHSSVA